MSLSVYRKKRSFGKTPEPSGRHRPPRSGQQLRFVIQKHAASHLHYDLRLEMRGVLKSWAVPKGPSMDPADKRLAMLVEDHPFDYKDFEGIIPKGNYGAGTVIIWDKGSYAPAEKRLSREEQEKKLLRDFHKGSLRIVFRGRKVKGEFSVVRTPARGENAWLLMKKKDENALAEDITKQDRSVVSNRTIEEMAASRDARQWSSNRNASGKMKETGSADGKDISTRLRSLRGKKKAPFPKSIFPMLATLVDKPFDAEGWSYEVKWDGYRAVAYLKGREVELRSRNNKSFTEQYYPVTHALSEWDLRAVLDGEIVVLDEKGHASFGDLQNWRSEADGELHFYVFDLLWLEGYDLTTVSLSGRRELLQLLVPEGSIVRFSESFETTASEFFGVAETLGLEGIIAKKTDSFYFPGLRTREWLKIKSGKRHEAIICGYTLNEDSKKLFSALILGVYRNEKLEFIGQVGTGFTQALQREILEKLKSLKTSRSPFEDEPEINKPTRFRPRPPKAKVTWVKPKLVCEVQYQELTGDGIMRHPAFRGLRADKNAKEVVEEQPERTAGTKPEKKSPGLRPAQSSGRKTLVNPTEETQTKLVSGQQVKFTNLKKFYWPKEKITKGDMINYYYRVAPYMLPYMKDRPQSLNRHPNGIAGKSFYQKNVASKIPSWLATHDYENTTSEGRKKFLVCTDEASLLYMANLGCIEMNPWHSRVQSPDLPDWCVIDLDPDTNSFAQVIEAANVVRKILDAAAIPSFPKTSGSTGIHIYIPLGARYDYEQSKLLAELIANLAHREIPSFSSVERNPAKRKGKIYLDFLQNRSIQTIAAPYSLRPRPGATVSAPLRWEEVKKGLEVLQFNISNMAQRLRSEGDLFQPVLGAGIDLEQTLKQINTVFG